MAAGLRKISQASHGLEWCMEEVKDPYAVLEKSFSVTRGETGLIIESNIQSHECSWDENHPECPDRMSYIVKRMEDLNLIDRCKALTPRKASKEEIMLFHSEEHYESLQIASEVASMNYGEQVSTQFDSVYINNNTFYDSLVAAGSTIKAVEEVWNGTVQNAMALVRPPGHHAMCDEFNGYCFFNNVALAAKHALEVLHVERILVVDFDVHHGQGIQKAFYADRRVLYFSIHRYEDGSFWPNLRLSNYDYIGESSGKGFNWNVPLNQTSMKDGDYLAILHQLLLPVATEFHPELVIVSAGYDAAYGCPEFDPQVVLFSAGYDSAIGDKKGLMQITPSFYSHMVWSLMQLANGKLILSLEGGYCLKTLAEGAALSLCALLGDPCPDLGPIQPPCPSINETILNVISVQRTVWKCLKIYPSYVVKGDQIIDIEKHVVEPKFLGEADDEPKTFEPDYSVQSDEEKALLKAHIQQMIATAKYIAPPKKVCIVYDETVLKHFPTDLSVREYEVPRRVQQIISDLKEWGLYNRCTHLKSRKIKVEELKLAHDKLYVDTMNNSKFLGNEGLMKLAKSFSSIYLCTSSVEAARAAAGGVLQIVDGVLSMNYQSGAAIVRPPGHHSGIDTASGFCVFNNVAIAANYARSKYGLSRVVIIDWDIHHGNGTQEIFKSDPHVLYISLHRFGNTFFPYSSEGAHNYVGEDSGIGFNVNIPWTEARATDRQYVAAFQHVVMPICYQFNPELVLVSAGFDGLEGDPIGACKVTPQCFAHLTHYLKALAHGKVILCLEGGYNVRATSYGMAMCIKALLGDPLPSMSNKLAVKKSAYETLQQVVAVQKKFWSCLKINVIE